jgi:CHAT domain-containing protein
MARHDGDRAGDIEQAIASLEIAVRLAPSPEHRNNLAIKLAVAYSERLREDPDENAEIAVKLMRATLSDLSAEAPEGFPEHVKASLAIALTRRRLGVHQENLREAIGLLREAIAVVTPEHDLENWAHRQINLANALLELGLEGQVDMGDAATEFEALVREADRLTEAGQVAQVGFAYFGLGVVHRQPSDDFFDSGAASRWEATGAADAIDPGLLEALTRAREHFEKACSHLKRGSIESGWAFSQLATTRGRLGDEEGSIEAGRRVLEGLKPTAAPAECLPIAKALGELHARREEWDRAAGAFRQACEASELRFLGTRDLKQREAESHEATSLTRWAAHVIARTGDPLEALLLLESGRTREQRLRLGAGEDSALENVPADLREVYAATLSDLAAAPLGPRGADESRRLVEVVEAIRSHPGFERFGMGVSEAVLKSVVEPGFPLVYINPTPYGTVFLEVLGDGAEIEVTATFLDSPLSTEVLRRLRFGDAAPYTDLDDFEAEGDSYLHAIGAYEQEDDEEDDFELAVALDEILPWLGEQIAGPLLTRLKELQASGVVLVPCGILALAPLHAATWIEEDGSHTCLLEHLDVRFAPSAYLLGKAKERLRGGRAERLIALGNPDSGDATFELPAAEAEVAEVAALFESRGGTAATASGADATWGFLVKHVEGATHVHLACHAKAGTFERSKTGIYLYDDFVSANVLGALPNFDARLIVVSACQSAVADTVAAPEESFSIITALLGSGGSCVIASLWPVSDISTAILMTRFYENLGTGETRPSGALRTAALWLRDLTEPEERRYLTAHPALEAEVNRRSRRTRQNGRGASSASSITEPPRPYAEPEYWAAFIVAGL